MSHKEQRKRSIIKAITFRVLVVIFDFIVVMAFTGRYDITIGVVLVTNIARTFFYYFHERAWNKITWGRQ